MENEFDKAKLVPILDHQHFIKSSQQFDKAYYTKTYIGSATISNILNFFPPALADKRTATIKLHDRISQNIKLAFEDKNRKEFTSYDYLTNGGAYELHFFNSLYRFLIDIRDGKGLYGPLSISKFQNDINVIHPGSHRLAMVNVYDKPVTYVLTDYRRNLDPVSTREFGKKIWRPEDKGFNWRNGRWSFRHMQHCSQFWRSTGKELQYRDIIDTFVDNEEHSFHKPETADRHYVNKGDIITVNGMPVCEKIESIWRVCPA